MSEELDKAIEKAEREIQGWEPEYLRSGNYRAIVCDIIRRHVEPVIEAKDKRIAELEQVNALNHQSIDKGRKENAELKQQLALVTEQRDKAWLCAEHREKR